MLTYLEGTRFKLQSTLLELDHKPRGSHPLAPHIQVTRDKNGLQQSILKVPLWLKNNETTTTTTTTDGQGGVEESAIGSNDDEYVDRFIIEQSNGGTAGAAGGEDNCMDVRNEVVISNYTPAYNRRSKSSLEMPNCQFTAQKLIGDTATTTVHKEHTNGAETIYDRGIADGGSNQHDSDFGEKRGFLLKGFLKNN